MRRARIGLHIGKYTWHFFLFFIKTIWKVASEKMLMYCGFIICTSKKYGTITQDSKKVDWMALL